ncbi:uncharacterized protein SETTUDRAFT_138644, partial [Exserohilum turcica Et28A]
MANDEEARLLREELEYEDTRFPASSCFCACQQRFLNFLRGPQHPKLQSIKPFFASIQRRPSDWLENHRLNRPVSLVLLLVSWLVIFGWFLTVQLPLRDGNGKDVVNLSCDDTLWKRKNECGINGINCRPFTNHSFAFRCPAKCKDVQLLNPRIIGNGEVNYRPLVVGTGIYRGDSFLCASAIHAGIVDDKRGGSGRINLLGQHDNFSSTKHHGIESIAFDSYFPLSFSVVFDETFKAPPDPRSILLPVSLFFTAMLALFSSSPKIVFPIFALIFAHVSFVSDPPTASELSATVLPDHIMMFAQRLLPAMFVMVVLYSTTIKRTLSGLTAHFEKTLLWLGGFWIGALSNYTLEWIPISRLDAHDLEQQPGAKLALASIILLLVMITVGQVYYFWLEGRLVRYLKLYGLFALGILVCLVIPGVNLRIHHYIMALMLLPGTSLQTRPSLLYQGILLGLFVNGIARWGFDSVLQTPAALLEDARIGSVVPKILGASMDWDPEIGIMFTTFTYGKHPPGVDGISIMVNDVERDRDFSDSQNEDWDTYSWRRPMTSELTEYFRWAYIRGGRTLDYSKPATLFGNGTWTSIPP